MKKIKLLVGFFIYTLSLFSQSCDCDVIYAEYNRLRNEYTTSHTLAQKKNVVSQMQKVIKYDKDCNCGINSGKWDKDIQKYKADIKKKEEELGLNTIFKQSTYTFKATNATVSIEYNKPKKSELQFVRCPEWLKLIESNEDSFTFTITANPSIYVRTDTIEVTDGKNKHLCIVNQEAATLQVNITERLTFGQDEGTCYIFVKTNDTAWTISEDESWLHTTPTEYGARVTSEKNPYKKIRSAKIKVLLACGETRFVEVYQEIGRTTLTVPQKSFFFNSEGGTNNSVIVNCNYDNWSAKSSVKWLTVKKNNDGIRIVCKPNRNKLGLTRTGQIQIETNDDDHLVEVIVVTQDKAPAWEKAKKGVNKVIKSIGDFFKGKKSKE